MAAGYNDALDAMPQIKNLIARRMTTQEYKSRRKAFRCEYPEAEIGKIEIVEDFYSKNQFVFWIGGFVLSPIVSWLISLFRKVKTAVISFGKQVYLWIFKSHKNKLIDVENKIVRIEADIENIQDEIESKLVLTK
jgi:hypothetical protein